LPDVIYSGQWWKDGSVSSVPGYAANIGQGVCDAGASLLPVPVQILLFPDWFQVAPKNDQHVSWLYFEAVPPDKGPVVRMI